MSAIITPLYIHSKLGVSHQHLNFNNDVTSATHVTSVTHITSVTINYTFPTTVVYIRQLHNYVMMMYCKDKILIEPPEMSGVSFFKFGM